MIDMKMNHDGNGHDYKMGLMDAILVSIMIIICHMMETWWWWIEVEMLQLLRSIIIKFCVVDENL